MRTVPAVGLALPVAAAPLLTGLDMIPSGQEQPNQAPHLEPIVLFSREKY